MRAKTAGPSQRDAAGTSAPTRRRRPFARASVPTRHHPFARASGPARRHPFARASPPTPRHPFAGAVWLAVVLAGALIAGLVVGVQRLSAPAPQAEGRGGLGAVLEHPARNRGRAAEPAGRHRGLAVDLRSRQLRPDRHPVPPGPGGNDQRRHRQAARGGHADSAEPGGRHRGAVVIPAGGPGAAQPGADGPADRRDRGAGPDESLRGNRHRLRAAAGRRPAGLHHVLRTSRRGAARQGEGALGRAVRQDQRRGQLADQRRAGLPGHRPGRGPGTADGLRLPLGKLRARPDRAGRLAARRAAVCQDADPRRQDRARDSALRLRLVRRTRHGRELAAGAPAVAGVPRCAALRHSGPGTLVHLYGPGGPRTHRVVRECGQFPGQVRRRPGRRDRRGLPVDVRLRGHRHLGRAAAGAARLRARAPSPARSSP